MIKTLDMSIAIIISPLSEIKPWNYFRVGSFVFDNARPHYQTVPRCVPFKRFAILISLYHINIKGKIQHQQVGKKMQVILNIQHTTGSHFILLQDTQDTE